MSEEGRRSNFITGGVALVTIFLTWLLGYLLGKPAATGIACLCAVGVVLLLRGHFPQWFLGKKWAWVIAVVCVALAGGLAWVIFPGRQAPSATIPVPLQSEMPKVIPTGVPPVVHSKEVRIETPSTTLLSLGHIGRVEVGDSGVFLDGPGSREALEKFLGESHLVVEQVGGAMRVSTEMRNREGRLLGTLKTNYWQSAPAAGIDRNYTRNALEVLDESGDVVLQIIMLADRVQIQGKWYYSDRRRTIILKSKIRKGYARISLGVSKEDENNPAGPYPVETIDRIFKYPSSKYPGELLPIPILGGK
jgi:hypothetical protein